MDVMLEEMREKNFFPWAVMMKVHHPRNKGSICPSAYGEKRGL